MARDLSPELSWSAASSTRSSPMLSSSIPGSAPLPSTFSQLSASTTSSTRSPFDISLQRSTNPSQGRPAQRSFNSSASLASSTISSIPEDAVLQYCSGCGDTKDCCSRKNSSSSSTSSTSTISDSEVANLDIKMTLTDLLNCDSVRADKQMRLWVQARLMEAELELKRHRRRRVTPPISDV